MKADFTRSGVAMALLLTGLTGCDSGARQEGKGTPGGEVIAGSVSDAMLPVDSVRSQAPLAGPGMGEGSEPGEGGKGGAGKNDGGAAARRGGGTSPEAASPAAAPADEPPAGPPPEAAAGGPTPAAE